MTGHSAMMESFYAAREIHRDAREEYAIGYDTEGAEYDELNPPPRLRDFMADRPSATPPGVCDHGFYLVDCPHVHDTPAKLKPSQRKAWNRDLSALARDRGVYKAVMAAWEEVTELRLAGVTPEDALNRVCASFV
jgi:hypothetical protein